MKNLIRASFILVLAVLVSCNVTLDPTHVSNEILVTDAEGNIIGGNYNDWCYGDPNEIQFRPAYPNPVTNGKAIIFFTSPDDVYFTIYFDDLSIVYSNYDTQPGNYYLDTLDGNQLGFSNEVRTLKLVTSTGYQCEGHIQF